MPPVFHRSGVPSRRGQPITSFAEDRVKWNTEWEEEISWSLVTPGFKPIDMLRSLYGYLSTEESETEMQHVLAMHRDKYRRLCQSLTHLAQAVAVCYATHDFLRKWLSVSASVRQEHILEGLVRSCSEADFFRLFCDELTLHFLERGGGQGFLDLLKHFTLDDYSQVPKKPIYLKSRHWYPADPAAESQAGYDVADATFNLERSYLIGQTLHETLRSFHGLGDEQNNPKRVARDVAKSRLSQLAQRFEYMAHGPDAAAAIKERYREHTQELKDYAHIALCESCRKPETPGSQRFMRCKACIENVSRKVYYCSRQCQREDWKVRHKRICGKAMTVQESEETANIPPKPVVPPPSAKAIGPPIMGFKRSPALVYQVNLLNENAAAGTDYILITRTQRVFRLKIDDDNEKRAFRTFRDLALSTGDREAVTAIGQFLVKPPGGAVGMFGSPTAALGGPVVQLGHDRQDAFDQLQREYGFDVKSTVNALERKRGEGLTEVEKEVLSQDYSW
ncbi:hypothetical protein B0H19DRAFT_1268573 [Mycena capillaripes]|nr:hypothetical protein B0H19DRAFT_1268573 [Mycena capillaripes]